MLIKPQAKLRAEAAAEAKEVLLKAFKLTSRLKLMLRLKKAQLVKGSRLLLDTGLMRLEARHNSKLGLQH